MESKYYEPEIEDLNIGQEIWITNLDNYAKVHDNLPCKGIITELTDYPTVWVKTEKNSKYEIYPYMIEIKYLDKEDIESLGWNFNNEHLGPYLKFKFNNSFRYLYFDAKYNKIVIDNGGWYEHNIQYFQGTIKNKSELIKLMKQIGINGK